MTLAVGIGGLVLVAVGLFVSDWFTLKMSAGLADAMGGRRVSIGIDLRTITICQRGAPCVSMSLSASQASFGTIAQVTFFGSIVFAIGLAAGVIGPQVGIHMSPAYGRRVAVLGALMLVATLITAFVLGPDTGKISAAAGSLTISHGFGGLALGIGIALGIYALLQLHDDEPHAAEPVVARYARPAASRPPPMQASPVHVATVATVAPVVAPVRCAAATIALSESGIDTNFVDGNIGLVEWGEVVGVVARQLPAAAPYHGAMFVDIISGPHATVRALPTTRITGADVSGDGADRVRTLIAAIRGFAPAAKLDSATRAMCDQGAPVRQLADAAELASHDERLP